MNELNTVSVKDQINNDYNRCGRVPVETGLVIVEEGVDEGMSIGRETKGKTTD